MAQLLEQWDANYLQYAFSPFTEDDILDLAIMMNNVPLFWVRLHERW